MTFTDFTIDWKIIITLMMWSRKVNTTYFTFVTLIEINDQGRGGKGFMFGCNRIQGVIKSLHE